MPSLDYTCDLHLINDTQFCQSSEQPLVSCDARNLSCYLNDQSIEPVGDRQALSLEKPAQTGANELQSASGINRASATGGEGIRTSELYPSAGRHIVNGAEDILVTDIGVSVQDRLPVSGYTSTMY
jgi:hypothetical protein